MEYALRHEYPGICKDGVVSFGGNQRELDSRTLCHCGCGLVAALDLLRYFHLYDSAECSDIFSGIEKAHGLSLPLYRLCAQRMRRSYVPIVYPFGTTGVALAAGMNYCFQQNRLPYTASWGVGEAELWREIAAMLLQDLPVILSVGKGFPRFWEKRGVALSRRVGDTMRESTRIRAHFVTVVGMDKDWLRVSSWGREYYLSKEEFLHYRSTESLRFLCNILLIRRHDSTGYDVNSWK